MGSTFSIDRTDPTPMVHDKKLRAFIFVLSISAFPDQRRRSKPFQRDGCPVTLDCFAFERNIPPSTSPPLSFGLCRSWLAPRTVSITFIPQITRRRKKRPTLVAMLRVPTPAGTLPRPQPATPFSISDGSVGRRVSIRPSRRRGAEGQAGCTSRRGRKQSPAMDSIHIRVAP